MLTQEQLDNEDALIRAQFAVRIADGLADNTITPTELENFVRTYRSIKTRNDDKTHARKAAAIAARFCKNSTLTD